MKTFFKVISLALSLAFMLTSCETADDNNPSPVPDVRDKFVGDWNVDESCSKANYEAQITKDSENTAQVLVYNFADSKANEPDTGLVLGSKVVLYAQYNSEGWFIEGSGDYQEDGSLTWNFTLIISGFEESCTATFTKN
jgi:hypothetical protein